MITRKRILLVFITIIVVALCFLALSFSRTTTKLTTIPILATPTVFSTQNPSPDSVATFTGNASYNGYDKNGDGFFEYFQVNVEVEVSQAGGFGFSAYLDTLNGDTVSMGGVTPERRSLPAMSASLNTGIQYVSLYFDGNDIRYDDQDGPYKVIITMTGHDRIHFTTGPINHRDFWYKDGARCDYAIQMFCRLRY